MGNPTREKQGETILGESDQTTEKEEGKTERKRMQTRGEGDKE